MGQIELAGPNALAAVQQITSNDAAKLQNGQAQYSALTTPEGTFVDDVLVYRLAERHFLLVVNASNIEKDHAWIAAHAPEAGEVAIVNSSDRYALIAVQGPKARGIVQTLTAVDLAGIKYYWFAHGEVAGVRGHGVAHRLHRRGRLRDLRAAAVRHRAVERAARGGEARRPRAVPASARATRCASKPRCASTATTWTRPPRCSSATSAGSSAGTSRSSSAATCCGARRPTASTRKIVGFEMLDRAIARHGHDGASRRRDGRAWSRAARRRPFLKKAIGMAYVPTALAAPGTEFDIDIRGRMARAVVVPMPFYKRPRS